MQLLRLLYVQVLLAIVAGVLIGHFAPEVGIALKPLGDGFIRLIRMLIAPIIFCTVVLGIAGMDDLRSVGRTGLLALGYFEAVTTLALILGLVVINVAAPGVGMHVDPSTLDAERVAAYATQAERLGVVDYLLNVIPVSIFDAFVRGDILQVLLVAILTGFALQALGARAAAVRGVIDGFSQVLFRIVGFIMRVAPIGALGAMAFTIGSQGLSALAPLAGLMACFYVTCLVFVFGVLGLIARLHGFSIIALLRYIGDELLIVLGTSSSESVLPQLMLKLQRLGAGKTTVGLVVPTGYSFNLDGTNIYMTLATLFLAQATNTPLTLTQELTLLGVAMLTSKGASGVTGAGFITLAATLAVVPDIPVAALALLVGVDRFMSECRALTNLVGNGVGALVIARWEGDLDRDQLAQELARGPSAEILPVPAAAAAD